MHFIMFIQASQDLALSVWLPHGAVWWSSCAGPTLQSTSLCCPLSLSPCVSVSDVAAFVLPVLSRVTCRVHRMLVSITSRRDNAPHHPPFSRGSSANSNQCHQYHPLLQRVMIFLWFVCHIDPTSDTLIIKMYMSQEGGLDSQAYLHSPI